MMDRRSTLLLVCVVWAQCLVAMTTTTEVKMDDDSANSKCGQVFELAPSEEVRLTSNGLAPKGYCGVTIFSPTEINNYTCDAICVNFKIATMSTCDVKLKFVGHTFKKNGDLVKEFSCLDRNKEAFCWSVSSMRIEVIEKYDYSYTFKRPLYEFDIDTSIRCSGNSAMRKSYHTTQEELDASEHKTYVEGIAVGVSLACIFLIVLFIGWCYTKHQAVQSRPGSSDTTAAKTQKPSKGGKLFSSFRSKLNITRKRTESSDEPTATYRKTTGASNSRDDPEAATELSPLKIETKHDTEGETFELAQETPIADKDQNGQDSPKDGGAEEAKLAPPEVVIVPGTPEPSEDADDTQEQA